MERTERTGWRELRTGDAGRWREDGLLEHMGRLDDTVKIRGHRVDPAEVESLLAQIDTVNAAAVVVRRDDALPQMEASIELMPGVSIDAAAVRKCAANLMPDYMVPANIHILERLPRLGNGKVDRQTLLANFPKRSAIPVSKDLDPLERTLHGLFCRVLRRKDFGIDDSFFELGGDSLSAATLFSGISKILRLEMPLTELMQHPSVSLLASRIRSNGWNLTDNPVALLTPSPAPDSVNLFAWPGAGSDVTALAALAQHLGSGISFYAIQHRGADGRQVYDLTIDAMAKRGMELIRRVQPTGPYLLCGTSFGGIVALETARLLRAAGERVSFLGLLDTYAPGYPAPRDDLGIIGRLKFWLRELYPLGHKDVHSLAMLKRGLIEKKQNRMARRFVRKSKPDAPPFPMPDRFLYLQEACFIAGRDYRPRPYDGETHLFRVEMQPPAHIFKQDETLGWNGLFTGILHTSVIPGRHGWHIREPHVRTLAALLGESIARTRQAPEASGQGASPFWDAASLWNTLAAWWDSEIGDEGSDLFRKHALAEMFRFINPQPGEKILDISCGNGWFARKLARVGARVLAVDISEGMLERARERSRGLEIEYRVMDATNASDFAILGNGDYHTAVCNMALQDLSSTDALFSETLRALRPGGKFILSFVHPSSASRSGSELNVPVPQAALPGQPVPHIEIMRAFPDIIAAARRAGWNVDAQRELPDPSSPVIGILTLSRPR